MKRHLSTIPSDQWPDPWRGLVKKIDTKRDHLEEALARLRDEERQPNGRRKIDVVMALSLAIKELADLTCWAHSPDAEPLPAGWFEATRKRLQGAILPAIRAADRFKEHKVSDTLSDAHGLAMELATALADRMVEQPDPTPAPPTDPTPVIISLGERSYAIGSNRPIVVTREEDAMLQAFIGRDAAMTTEQLGKRVANVSRVVKRLDTKFPGAVHRPAMKGAGYFINVVKIEVSTT